MKTSDRWLKYWEKYYKSIPQRGLNNLTKKTYNWRRMAEFRAEHGMSSEWQGVPTLPRRIKKIDVTNWMNATKLPYNYFVGSELTSLLTHTEKARESALPEVKRYTVLIIERLDTLLVNMDGVTVLTPVEINACKEKILQIRAKIVELSGWIGLSQEAEFEVLPFPTVDYDALSAIMNVKYAYTREEVTKLLEAKERQALDMLLSAWKEGIVDMKFIKGTQYWKRRRIECGLILSS